MSNRIFRKILSVVLAFTILLTSNSLLLQVFAVTEDPGVGIFNNLMSSDDNAETKYTVQFFKLHDPLGQGISFDHFTFDPVQIPNELAIAAGRTLTPSPGDSNTSYIILDKGEKLAFSDSAAFIGFLRDNNICKMVITHETGYSDQQETSVLYSEKSQTYEFGEEYPFTSIGGTRYRWESWLTENDDKPFGNHDYHLKRYDSAGMTEVTLEQDWRDRGDNTRPLIDDVKFDLYRGEDENREKYLDYQNGVKEPTTNKYVYTVDDSGVEGGSYHAYMSTEDSGSNAYLYHFTVPEFAPDGTAYVYTSEYPDAPGGEDPLFPHGYEDTYEAMEHIADPGQTPPVPEPNKYLAVGLTEFSFTMTFKDVAEPTARPDVDADFILNHFVLYKKDSNSTNPISIVPEGADSSDYLSVVRIGETDNYTVTVKRLEDINEDGSANEYSIGLKPAADPEEQHKLPVSEHATDQTDYYEFKAENSGIHANDTTKAYEGGQIDLLLKGTTDFNAYVEWKDKEETETRRGDEDAASLTLWRYLEGDDIEYSAIVSDKGLTNPITIRGDEGEITGDVESKTNVSFQNLEKYDNQGRKYLYYAIENVTVDKEGTMLPYQVEYTNDSDNKRLWNGETAINKLSDKVEFSVSVEWIAAARQGGTAEATYQLQIQDGDNWVPVVDDNNNPLELTLDFNEFHMKREGGDECIFPEVDLYDADGKLNHYRVVQTSVSRRDEIPGIEQPQTYNQPIACEGSQTQADITVNDEYLVTMTENGTDFHFRYNIQGNTFVNVKKEWVDGNTAIQTDDSYSAKFKVQNYNSANLEYQDYFTKANYPDGFFDGYLQIDEEDPDYTAHINDNRYFKEENGRIVFDDTKTAFDNAKGWEKQDIPVPKYDSDGREIAYRTVEMDIQYPRYITNDQGEQERVGFYTTYAWRVENTGLGQITTNYYYTATNHRTYERSDHAEIDISKEWVDDGELEYRKPVKVNASANVHSSGAQSVTLQQSNMWEDRVNMNVVYQRDPDHFNEVVIGQDGRPVTLPGTYVYDPEDFREGGSNDGTQYWSKEDIINLYTLNPSDSETAWMYHLLTSRNSGNTSLTNNNTIDLNNVNGVSEIVTQGGEQVEQPVQDGTSLNGIRFEKFAGIYKSAPIGGDPKRCHYYAVSQEYSEEGVNGAYASLRFINTRIGIVNYEIKFDWVVGSAISDGTIRNVTVRIEGEGLPEGGIIKTISPNDLVDIQGADGKNYKAFYVFNLPKYDEMGKLIQYSISKLKFNDGTCVVNGDTNEVDINGNRCKIKVSSETITEGNEGKTDDLRSVTITNTFEDSTSITVHKKWADDSNKDNTRTDLFLKLHRHSSAQGAAAQTNTKEYEWRRGENDGDNEWSYTFADLPKYDEAGYPFTYYVTEQTPDRLPGYEQIYISNATWKDPEDETITIVNPKVYLDVNSPDFLTNVAYDGGTIINRLYGEIVINGEKLWKGVSPLLENTDYPIAHVRLYRKVVSDGLTPYQLEQLDVTASLQDTEIAAGKVLISETDVMNGDKTFRFTSAVPRAIELGFVIMDGDRPKTIEDDDGNPDNNKIVLPKYDKAGRVITYLLEEENLNGYLSSIVADSTQLINQFTGGRKLQFKVTKNWSGMENQNYFPNIKFTLHQVFKKNDGTYCEYNHFDRTITSHSSGEYVTFDEDTLRYYSPRGTPFTYFVTETLSNIDGDTAIFIEKLTDESGVEYIPQYLAPYRSDSQSQIIELLQQDESGKYYGQALGFTSTVTETLGDAETAIMDAMPPIGEPDPDDPRTEEEKRQDYLTEQSNDTEAAAVDLDETVQNTYQPDDTNFQGHINVTKEWDTDKLNYIDKTTFDQVRAYSFTLSRFTKLIPEQTLFEVDTTDSLSASPVPAFTHLADGITVKHPDPGVTDDFVPSATLPDADNKFGTAPEEGKNPRYYVGILEKDNKNFTVVIEVGEVQDGEVVLTYVNNMYISGFAVYGHDALKYTYKVTENPKSGYTPYLKTDKGNEKQLSNDLNSPAPVVELGNRLDVFNIQIHKTFAKEYEDSSGTHIEPLTALETSQFFNEAYFGQLEFKLLRSSVPNVTEEAASVTGDAILDEQGRSQNGIPKAEYTYTFADLPITDINGRPYTYWLVETDGAQSVDSSKVYTRYAGEAFTDTTATLDPNRHTIDVQASDKNTTKDTFVQNVFKAKKIKINKYWLDNNNEDGTRLTGVSDGNIDDSLKAILYEYIQGMEGISNSREIRYSLYSEGSEETGWTTDPAIAHYFFDGSTARDLEYSIYENVPAGYELVINPGTYGSADNDREVYSVGLESSTIPVSDITPRSVEDCGTLNLTNFREPQKSQLTLHKQFSGDDAYRSDTRPGNLYFVLADETGNAYTKQFYEEYKVKVTVGDTQLSLESLPTTGVITVPQNSDFSYPDVTVSNLPLGVSTNCGLQKNGEFAARAYQFVECSDDGSALADSFPYTYSGLAEINEDWEIDDSVVVPYYDNFHHYNAKNSGNDFNISYNGTNTLKTENHTVNKKWNDDANNGVPNYYKTRPDNFLVSLQQTADQNPSENSDWVTINSNISLATDKQSTGYLSYLSESAFRNLPRYDKDGNKYYYRVVETYIGPEDSKYQVSNRYHNPITGETYDAAKVYYVDYDDDYSDKKTDIDNYLIRKTRYQNFKAYKYWSDNTNQDGLREPVRVRLNQYRVDSVTQERTLVDHGDSLTEELNESNNWYFEWRNYPNNDEDGNEFEYEVVELSDIDGYSTANIHTYSYNPAQQDGYDADSHEKEEFTNTHSQDFKSLKVSKNWTGEYSAADKLLRPDSITYELYCKYTAYKYNDDHTDFVVDTEKSFDGKLSEATALLDKLYSRYLETTQTPLSREDYISSLGADYFAKTVTPSDGNSETTDDRATDALWTDVVFENLPVNINTCADGKWMGKSAAIQYYVKEVEPEYQNDGVNPYEYGVNGYLKSGQSQWQGTSTITTLTNGTADNPDTVTATNELKRRDIPVTKVWVDNGYTEANLHYAIDFTLTCSGTVSGYTHDETLTLAKDAETVTFLNLPEYDSDGSILNYSIDEKVHVDSGTAPANRYGYVRADSEERTDGYITAYTITNTLPVIRFKADKLWNDNRNQDGKRPEQLNFALSRTADSATDSVKTLNDGSAAHQTDTGSTWAVDFGVQPQYNENNTAYVYSVEEAAASGDTLAARGYTRYAQVQAAPVEYGDKNNFTIADTDTDIGVVTTGVSDGVNEKTFRFMNRYTPLDDSLTVNKSWFEDGEFYTWTRPDSVFVDLCYQINDGAVVNLYTAEDTDPVKKLLKQADSAYSFRREIKAAESWTKIFDKLPLNVNPTGTLVFNGQSYQITYSVQEVQDLPLTGYTKNDSASTVLHTDADDSLTVSNTLLTTTVTVQKVWKDGYAGDQAEHYDVHLTLANMNYNLPGAENTTLNGIIVAASTDTSETDTTSQAVQFIVPQYVKGGTAASYTLTEDATDQRYGYVTTYENNEFGTPGQNPNVTVFNTLPLTQVSVTKEWDDESNKFALRQSIQVELQRKLETEENWTTRQTVTLSPQDYSGNSWTYTFNKLPKFDVNNNPYQYRVVEAQVNAYDTSYKNGNTYQAEPVSVTDNSNSQDSTLSFDVKNTLITEDITLRKIWDDRNYHNTHYPVTYTIKQPDGALIDFDNQVNYDTTGVTFGASDNTATEWTTTVRVPVYDRDGTPILYTVTETSEQHYGYQAGSTATTQTGTHTGNTNYYNTYTITNALPVTDVTAVKHWAGDLELYPNASATVKVNLTRASNGTADSGFNEEKQITYVNNNADDSETFGNLLSYDFDNHEYTYTVTEQTVTGYATGYENQSVSATADNRTVTITNTPKKGSADFVKYDLTDLEKHGADSRFSLITLADAKFELHRVLTGAAEEDKVISVQETTAGARGSYTVIDSGAGTDIYSGANGVITFTNLEPNKYYLKEIAAPQGYQLNNAEFHFEVSVNDSNQIVVSYTQQAITKQGDALKWNGGDFTAASAKETLADLTNLPHTNTVQSVHGIPNEEEMSHLRLTKVDRNAQTEPVPNATYYLLRLYNFEYKKDGAQGSNAQEYLTNALNTLTADYSSTSSLWTYWEKVGTKATGTNGEITFDGHMFGTYIFYEVKEATGFERDFTHNSDTAAADDPDNPQTNVVGPVYLDSGNASHGSVTHNLTHLEPRKNAHINVLKTDENGNPLRNAVFKLYQYVDGEHDTELHTFRTGYDGMDANAFTLDSSLYPWNQQFYLIEETPPTGYDANNVPEKHRIAFTLTPELAEEPLHIVRANDVRLKGKIDLTKVSAAQTTTHNAGDPLSGAEFALYTKSGTQLSLYPHTSRANTYRVVYADDDPAIVHDAGFDTDAANQVTTLTTGADGELHIEGAEWGDYYLLETRPPAGYQLPTGEDARVYFSVGRTNSGAIAQQLTMKNDPETAQLNISKQIDQKNVAAWGEPVFIFKVQQTARYDYVTNTFVALDAADQRTLTKTISPTTAVTGGFRDATGAFDVEPGTYRITEVRVARYAAAGDSVTTETSTDKVTDTTNTPYTATLSIKPGGVAEVAFSNLLRNYEKLSHADKKDNSFNGYKAIEVHDKDGLSLTDTVIGSEERRTAIPKSALTPELIRSDGTRVPITDYSKLVITTAETDFTLTDNGAAITIQGRREDISGSVYKLTATYDGKFTDEFELRFLPDTLFTKTEKTVIFKNDALNRSHYTDGAAQTDVYSLMFVLEVVPAGGSGTTEAVRRILHNGVTTGLTDQSAFPTPVIEGDYSSDWEFNGSWTYSYHDGGTVRTGTVNSAELLEVIRNAPDNAEITVTANLYSKS